MATKFERYIDGAAEREKRKANIEKLRKMIAADEDVLAVIPNDHSKLDAQQERRLMSDHISRLREWLNEEIAAYNATMHEDLDINI